MKLELGTGSISHPPVIVSRMGTFKNYIDEKCTQLVYREYWRDRVEFCPVKISPIEVQTQIFVWSDFPHQNNLWSDFPDGN